VTGWLLRYDGWDPGAEALRETLCALGNGRLDPRGSLQIRLRRHHDD
jgi:trehalose/maltose hydrolase-like predicted phosphorylase